MSACEAIRRDLMDKCNLHTILRLPTGIFYAQGVKTNVLFFTRGEKDKGNTREVWVYDLRANMQAFGKRTALGREHFAAFEEAFGRDPLGASASLKKRKDEGEQGRWRRFTREEIAQRGDNLDIAWLEDESDEGNGDQETTLDLACVATRVITYGVVKLGEEVPGGVPCLRTSNVRWLSIETAEFKSISPDISAQYGRTILQGGEVLVNVRGTLGGVAVVPKEMRGWNVSREVAVVPVDKQRVLPAFLAYWIASQRSQRWLARVEKGVAYTGINIEDLRALPVACPPIDEQREAVRRVESLFALADSIEARWRASRAQIERLTPSLLAKAFRGELVPQDPNDEPASALLARLRSPDAREKAPLTRKLGRPQAMAKAKETVA